ncbi:MAG: TlpA family protein disulfide reductase, partial [Candidatus Heimdallarchaeota archaeon]
MTFHKRWRVIKWVSLQILIASITIPWIINTSYGTNMDVPIGAKAPDFTLRDITTDNYFSLRDFLGKVVILDLFATWCQPCIEAMPYLNRIQQCYNSSELAIISIDVDVEETQSQVEFFAETNKMTWIVAMDSNSIVDAEYGTRYIPTLYIIDQEGYVHFMEIGFSFTHVNDALQQLIQPKDTEFNGSIQILPSTTPMTFDNTQLNILAENITTTCRIDEIYVLVTPGEKLENSRRYFLTQTSGGMINETISIDPIQLYLQSYLNVTVVAVDYVGNQKRESKTIAVAGGSVDTGPPFIHEVTLDYVHENNSYYFAIKAIITDDTYVYRVEMVLLDGTKPYATKCWRDPYNKSVFHGTREIKDTLISNPEDISIKIHVEDIVLQEVEFPTPTDKIEQSTSLN